MLQQHCLFSFTMWFFLRFYYITALFLQQHRRFPCSPTMFFRVAFQHQEQSPQNVLCVECCNVIMLENKPLCCTIDHSHLIKLMNKVLLRRWVSKKWHFWFDIHVKLLIGCRSPKHGLWHSRLLCLTSIWEWHSTLVCLRSIWTGISKDNVILGEVINFVGTTSLRNEISSELSPVVCQS